MKLSTALVAVLVAYCANALRQTQTKVYYSGNACVGTEPGVMISASRQVVENCADSCSIFGADSSPVFCAKNTKVYIPVKYATPGQLYMSCAKFETDQCTYGTATNSSMFLADGECHLDIGSNTFFRATCKSGTAEFGVYDSEDLCNQNNAEKKVISYVQNKCSSATIDGVTTFTRFLCYKKK